MKLWMHKVEVWVDRLVPPMLLVLLFLILVEIFFEDFAHHYEFWIILLDYIVILVFVLDVIFKYIRIKPFKKFLKKSWIDILAVFPFALLFRMFEGFFTIFAASEVIKEGQKIFHEAVELEKEGIKFLQEAEKAGKLTRTSRFARFIKPITRSPRLVKAFAFHEKPTGKHHSHDKERKTEKRRRKGSNKQI